MIAAGTDGTVGKFMSATHMGITSKPSRGAPGAKPWPTPSMARASRPRRSMMEVKSYFIRSASLLCIHKRGAQRPTADIIPSPRRRGKRRGKTKHPPRGFSARRGGALYLFTVSRSGTSGEASYFFGLRMGKNDL